MEGGPEIIFVLLFIAFSVLEGIGRKRKAQQKGPGKPKGSRPVGTASPEEIGGREREPTPSGRGGATARGTGAVGRPSQAGGSEGMIPKDIWEEILGLARGTARDPARGEPPPEAVRPPPRVEDETLEEIPPFEARTLEPLYVDRGVPGSQPRRGGDRGGGRGAVPARGGKAPPLPAKAAKGGAVTLPVPLPPAKAGAARKGQSPKMRELLGSGSVEDLRKAFILTEVLGPPLGLKE